MWKQEDKNRGISRAEYNRVYLRDLFFAGRINKRCQKSSSGAKEIHRRKTRRLIFVGVPLVIITPLYDCGAVLFDGQYWVSFRKPFSFARWAARFKSAADLPETTLWLDEEEVPVGPSFYSKIRWLKACASEWKSERISELWFLLPCTMPRRELRLFSICQQAPKKPA